MPAKASAASFAEIHMQVEERNSARVIWHSMCWRHMQFKNVVVVRGTGKIHGKTLQKALPCHFDPHLPLQTLHSKYLLPVPRPSVTGSSSTVLNFVRWTCLVPHSFELWHWNTSTLQRTHETICRTIIRKGSLLDQCRCYRKHLASFGMLREYMAPATRCIIMMQSSLMCYDWTHFIFEISKVWFCACCSRQIAEVSGRVANV